MLKKTGPFTFEIACKGGYALGWIESDHEVIPMNFLPDIRLMADKPTNYRNYYVAIQTTLGSNQAERYSRNEQKFQLFVHQALFMMDPAAATLKIDTETLDLVTDQKTVDMVSGKLYAMRFIYSTPNHRFDKFRIRVKGPSPGNTFTTSLFNSSYGKVYIIALAKVSLYTMHGIQQLELADMVILIFDFTPIQAQINSGGSGITDYPAFTGNLNLTSPYGVFDHTDLNTYKNSNTSYSRGNSNLNQYNFPEWDKRDLIMIFRCE